MFRPYVSEKNYWILAHHEIFQAYYYGDAMNINKNIRDRFKKSEHFKDCEIFCERYKNFSTGSFLGLFDL